VRAFAARIDELNARSIALVERLGFRLARRASEAATDLLFVHD
jgi:RimJ/RimL family protein N-acetyltransferase